MFLWISQFPPIFEYISIPTHSRHLDIFYTSSDGSLLQAGNYYPAWLAAGTSRRFLLSWKTKNKRFFYKGFPGLSFVHAIFRTPWHKDCSDKLSKTVKTPLISLNCDISREWQKNADIHKFSIIQIILITSSFIKRLKQDMVV